MSFQPLVSARTPQQLREKDQPSVNKGEPKVTSVLLQNSVRCEKCLENIKKHYGALHHLNMAQDANSDTYGALLEQIWTSVGAPK